MIFVIGCVVGWLLAYLSIRPQPRRSQLPQCICGQALMQPLREPLRALLRAPLLQWQQLYQPLQLLQRLQLLQ